MSAWKRRLRDGRLVLAVAVCGVAFQLFYESVAKPRGIRDELLIHDANWAAGMAVILGWALACIRRGPPDGYAAAWCALGLCLVGVAVVAVELVGYVPRPSWL